MSCNSNVCATMYIEHICCSFLMCLLTVLCAMFFSLSLLLFMVLYDVACTCTYDLTFSRFSYTCCMSPVVKSCFHVAHVLQFY